MVLIFFFLCCFLQKKIHLPLYPIITLPFHMKSTGHVTRYVTCLTRLISLGVSMMFLFSYIQVWGNKLHNLNFQAELNNSTPSFNIQHLTAKLWHLKDLSQNWQGYGRPEPPSSSPPVAMPRSQQPSGICEGDATSLLEGEEGTQDRPAGSSSPSEGDEKWIVNGRKTQTL